MKKARKITALLLSVLIVLSMTAVPVFAGTTIGNVTVNPDSATVDTAQIQNLGNTVIRVLQVVGVFVAVIILIVLGIKYMLGSAEEKAEYKKTLLPYLIGAVLIFGAVALTQIVVNFATINPT